MTGLFKPSSFNNVRQTKIPSNTNSKLNFPTSRSIHNSNVSAGVYKKIGQELTPAKSAKDLYGTNKAYKCNIKFNSENATAIRLNPNELYVFEKPQDTIHTVNDESIVAHVSCREKHATTNFDDKTKLGNFFSLLSSDLSGKVIHINLFDVQLDNPQSKKALEAFFEMTSYLSKELLCTIIIDNVWDQNKSASLIASRIQISQALTEEQKEFLLKEERSIKQIGINSDGDLSFYLPIVQNSAVALPKEISTTMFRVFSDGKKISLPPVVPNPPVVPEASSLYNLPGC
jgi:hypothetical protein